MEDEYETFTKKINEENFIQLWNRLKQIEEKYKDYPCNKDEYVIMEWESELCYEQGKVLEYIEWVGKKIDDIPAISMYYCTYSKMSYEQLQYYLYWRSCFRRGEVIVSCKAYYYLCAYELVADFGAFGVSEHFNQLECLYNKFNMYLTFARWAEEYAEIHELVIKHIVKDKSIYCSTSKSVQEILKAINGDYCKVYDLMYKNSTWKYKTLMRKFACENQIREVVIQIVSKLQIVFDNSGIDLLDFLVGKLRKKTVQYYVPYSGSIWTKNVLKKMGLKTVKHEVYEKCGSCRAIYVMDCNGNKLYSANGIMEYCDPYLSEYILKYTVMLFKKNLGDKDIVFPEKLKGALKVKFADGYAYVLSVEKKRQREEKIYLSLYDNITKIIEEETQHFFESKMGKELKRKVRDAKAGEKKKQASSRR